MNRGNYRRRRRFNIGPKIVRIAQMLGERVASYGSSDPVPPPHSGISVPGSCRLLLSASASSERFRPVCATAKAMILRRVEGKKKKGGTRRKTETEADKASVYEYGFGYDGGNSEMKAYLEEPKRPRRDPQQAHIPAQAPKTANRRAMRAPRTIHTF